MNVLISVQAMDVAGYDIRRFRVGNLHIRMDVMGWPSPGFLNVRINLIIQNGKAFLFENDPVNDRNHLIMNIKIISLP